MRKPIGQHWQQVTESEDLLGVDFRSRTFTFAGPKYPTDTTLIHHQGNPDKKQAILYIHGYTDYFFQAGLAEFFIKQGYRFYAIDLQGYGRSIRPSVRPNWCESIAQYGQDLNIALATMKKDGIDDVVILAHSTGGLIASTYLAQTQNITEKEQHYGKAFPTISRLILNSPFLALPLSPNAIRCLSWPIHTLVSLCPFCSLPANKPTVYAKTLHTSFAGEWDYRLDWKPSEGFPLSFHWLKQIITAQRYLAKQTITLPTLLCHSDNSTIGKEQVEEMRQGDGVLDIHSMQEAAEATFSQLTTASIPKGYHDLYLSPQPIRENYLAAIKDWLEKTA
ncbi:alpha/beta hydrolase [Marinomonas transparens]|uniref:Alpha/beta hydrolase n=1 Tax=Marinomonas transparens TaxID=2795388 RepID=A0A934JPC6_9GAMM|nr:alpha/beta hydrolase [Marinomonas transparens]MBJ7537288.1 alpha/beta hydrolase [Marinomonas transparens]